MSTRSNYDQLYQDFTLRHILFESSASKSSTARHSKRNPHGPAASMPSKPTAYKDSPDIQRDLEQKVMQKPARSRREVVKKALERVMVADENSGEMEFCMTAPSPKGDREENFVLRSTMSPKWQPVKSMPAESKRIKEKPTASSPIFHEIERSRMLETRLKELSEKYSSLQRGYKELLTRFSTPRDDFKLQYLELSSLYTRDKAAWEKRIQDLESELAKATSVSRLSPNIDVQSGSNFSSLQRLAKEDLFPEAEIESKQLATEVRELRGRLAAAEERIRVLEEADIQG